MVVFCHFILCVTPQVFDGVQVWAVSRPVKNFHLAFSKIFPNHFQAMRWCSIVHEYRGVMHHHVYIQLFLNQYNIFQAIYCAALGKKVQPSSIMFACQPSNHLAWRVFYCNDGVLCLDSLALVFQLLHSSAL